MPKARLMDLIRWGIPRQKNRLKVNCLRISGWDLSLISLMLTLFCGGASTALLGASNWLERTVYQVDRVAAPHSHSQHTKCAIKVMIDRFATVQDAPASCNQLGFCGGTLAGVQSKLDYIRALGADAIAISPISASESWHGFSPMDLYSVDPRFGTADDLRTLVS
ncbi:MAG: hypothetical protein EBZ48_14700, partial [Proteobacteria bacterium]|nr:hypothetical protein [Pseudomonadota bacterium]